MPPQEKKGLTGPVVRRAVTMRGATGEPGPEALRPRTAGAGTTASPQEPDSSRAAGTHGEETPTATAPVAPPAAEPASSEPEAEAATATTGKAESEAEAEPEAVSASPGAEAASSRETAAAARRGDDAGEGATGPLVATEGGSPPGVSEGDAGGSGEEPPSGRPTKALLAAAGIGGALLIAVPLLVVGTGRDDSTEPAGMARQASAQTLQDNEGPVRPGNYAPKPAETTTPPVKTVTQAPKKAAPRPAASTSAPKPAGPAGEAPRKESGPEPRTREAARKEQPGKKAPEPQKPKKKEQAKKKPAPQAPPNYSNMKRVLLRNTSTKMCADVPNFDKGRINGPVNQYFCNGTDRDNQLWDFEVKYRGKGPGSSDLFQIVNRKDGFCMDLGEFGGRPAGTKVSQFYCNGTTDDNQLWWLEPRGGKTFWIHNYASKQQCLEVVSGKGLKIADARLDIQPCHGGDDFEWTLW